MGLKLFVNNEQVWESEGDTTLVSSISGSTARGEFGRLGVANDIDRVDLFISVRDPIESSTDLDIRERNFRNQNSEELERRIADEGQVGDPANIIHNEALEESRNPSSDDSSDEATDTDTTATDTETPVNTSSSGGSTYIEDKTTEDEDTSSSKTIRIG